MRSLGGESAASLWNVSGAAPTRSMWVKQGFMQKTHDVDSPGLISNRLESEEKLIDTALKAALEVHHNKGHEVSAEDNSFLTLDNVIHSVYFLNSICLLFFHFHHFFFLSFSSTSQIVCVNIVVSQSLPCALL